jgi:hypothetical protein
LAASTFTDLKDVDQVGKFAISKRTARTSSALAAMVTVAVVGLDIAVGYPEVGSFFSTPAKKEG